MKILAVNFYNTYVVILVQMQNKVMRFQEENYQLCIKNAQEHYGLC